MQVLKYIVVLVASLFGYAPTTMGLVPRHCLHPPGRVIQTNYEAIAAARAAWHCVRPGVDQSTEEKWMNDFIAERRDLVWAVSETLPQGYVGGGLNFRIARDTGEIIDIELTQ